MPEDPNALDASPKKLSPSPSISAPSGKRLKSVLKKARIGRIDDASTLSLNGSDGDKDSNDIRNSVDSVIERKRSSVDDGLPAGPSNLSKLIPGRVKKKRRKRQEAEQLQQELAEGRGRSAEDQVATAADPGSSSANKSRSTLGEEGGSLITVESDEESPAISPTRPTPVTHPSHIGYLTSSSPLIKTTTIDEPPDKTLQLDGPSFQNPQYQKASSLPASASTSDLAPKHAATMDETRDGGRSLSVVNGSKTRGVSPGSRIKEVFTGKPRKKDTSPPKSPEKGSRMPFATGNGLDGLFNKDKRGSMSLGRSKASDSTHSLESNSRNTIGSTKELPIIVTVPDAPPSAGLEAPQTHVTPPTPTDQPQKSSGSLLLDGKAADPNIIVSASGNMISHRRVRSDSATQAPSKLSSVMSAPLTPMIEETKTPSIRTPSGQSSASAGGFFSSVFSAAQNAANQFTNTMSSTSNQTRSRSSTQNTEDDIKPQVDDPASVAEDLSDTPSGEEKKSALDTLGMGNLSLSHLGIADSPGANSTTSLSNGASEKGQILVLREEAAARAEDVSAARAVSQAYSEKTVENGPTPIAEDSVSVRPRSTYESSIITGDKTPPTGSVYEGDHGFRRSGSVRSRVGTIAKRHRNSSSATGGTIGAAIAAGNAALANPAAAGSTPKLTGFAVATKKRNRDFHQLFRSVPEDDYLIEDYSCALQRDIILAGRMYVSEGHICFSSNILGWITTLIINYDEIVSIEKESTAVVFPNAIAIQTLHARHTFRSLLSREATYDLLVGIWKINHPSLKSSVNGVRLDQGGTGDKTEKADPTGSDDASDGSEDDEEVYDEDEEDEGTGSFTEVPEGSQVGSDGPGDQQARSVARKVSALGVAAGAAAGGVPTPSDSKAGEKAAAASAASADFPGPATHAPTECIDQDIHYEKFLKDDVIPAPLGKVFSMVFGPASGGFMAKWLLDEMKCTDLQLEDDKKGLSDENKTRNFSYIKPLYASIGPKSTKCVVTETLEHLDLERAVSVTQSTQTPDVPSGNVFATKTHCCMMWAPGNATRIVMNFTIEWTGKSWLKGPIEKGAADGQATYCNDLVKALKAGVTSRPRAGTNGSRLKKGGKRKKGDTTPSAKSPVSANRALAPAQDSSWGLFEPLHGILGPVVDIISPMISSNVIIGLLLFIMLINYLRGPRVASTSLAYPGMPSSQRVGAYEEIWAREESDLWQWLEERVGMQGASYPSDRDDADAVAKLKQKRQQSLKGKGFKDKLADLRMSEREVDHAIRVTEEKLGVLKRAVAEKKDVEGKSSDHAGIKDTRAGVSQDEQAS